MDPETVERWRLRVQARADIYRDALEREEAAHIAAIAAHNALMDEIRIGPRKERNDAQVSSDVVGGTDGGSNPGGAAGSSAGGE